MRRETRNRSWREVAAGWRVAAGVFLLVSETERRFAKSMRFKGRLVLCVDGLIFSPVASWYTR